MRACTNLSIAWRMCCLFMGIIVTVDSAFGEEPVYFADANLKACVERQLGVSDPAPADMLALTSFRPVNCGIIRNFAGLEYAKNLESLQFDNTNWGIDITALAGLTNLRYLNLCNNRISDVSALAGLRNLRELHLCWNDISDISAVAGLTNLTNLDLWENRISDISAVGGLANLTHLDLSENGVSDMAVVAGLTNLAVLRLSGNRISDISPVAGLTRLTELSLYRNQIADVSAIGGLTDLTVLSLGQNQISDISALSGLTKLSYLYLGDSRITDISALLPLTSLKYVDLQANPLSRTSCETYVAQIRENNPGVAIRYYPYVQRTLSTSSTAGGSVSVPGEGTFPYDYGGTRPVTAAADPGYHFVFWTGTAVDARRVADPTAASTTVNLNEDYSLKAHFTPDRVVIYVDDDAIGANDGSSWARAYVYLQDALADANSSPKPVEVRVAQGVYRPDRGVGINLGDQGATFRLITGVTLKGGYAGCGAPDPNERDICLYETVLTGDLEGDDTDVYEGWSDHWYDPMWTDNSLHVVTATDTDASAVLDGFRIASGYFLGPPPIVYDLPAYHGGGMVIIAASPTLIDCTFVGNGANDGGGAVAHLMGSSATMVNCTFERNYGWSGGAITNRDASLTLVGCRFLNNAGGTGVGIYCGVGDLTVTGCEFDNNVGRYSGGALYCDYGSRVVLTLCFFIANSAQSGGAINVGGWPPGTGQNKLAIAENCIFAGNTASGCGSAIAGNVLATNCTFTGNKSLSEATISPGRGKAALVDCILWDNSEHPAVAKDRYPDPLFARAGYWADARNADVAVDPESLSAVWIDGDYHLKSQAGRWEPTSGSWVRDDVTSPCVDAGDSSRPVGDEPAPNGGIINVGAYGGTVEASMSFPRP